VSVTVTVLIFPLVVNNVPAVFSTGVGKTTLVSATLITNEPAAIVVVILSVADDPVPPPSVVTSKDTGCDDDVANAAGSVGTKLATRECGEPAAVSVDVLVLAVPLDETATG
jgi:hypothetical protein